MLLNNAVIWKVCLQILICYVSKSETKPATENLFLDLLYTESVVPVNALVTLQCDTSHKDDFQLVRWWRNDSAEIIAQQLNGDKEPIIHSNYSTRLKFDTKAKTNILLTCRVDDSAFYYCETLDSKNETATGKYVKLTVEESPYCEQQILSVGGVENTTIHLSCKVRGYPPPVITWMKNGNVIPKEDERFVQDESGLTLQRLDVKDGGLYQVDLENKLKKYTHVIELKVHPADDIKPENYKAVTEHNTVVVGCGKRLAQPGDTIEWFRAGINVINSRDDRFHVDTNGSLVIRNVLRSDTGLYDCASKRRTPDGEMTLSVNMFVNVRYAPSINNIKDVVIVYKGDSTVLPCTASGNPGVTFRWFLTDGKTEVTKSSKFEIATNGSLVIRDVVIHDGGNYTCAPFNNIGDGQHGHTDLRVYIPPKFHNDNREITTVRVDEKVSLDCSAYGVPPPNVTWMRDLNRKFDDKRVVKSPTGILTIYNITGEDSGKYVCNVHSPAGNITRSSQLQVIGKPGTPHIRKVTSNNRDAWVTWMPSFDGGSEQTFEFWSLPATRTEFEWDISLIVNYSKSKENDHILIFTGPEKDQNGRPMAYWCGMRAKNSEGRSDFSEVFKVTRSPGLNGKSYEYIHPYPLEPFGFEVNMSSTGYSLKWKSITTPGRPKPKGYRVQYKSENSTSGWATIKPDKQRRRRRSLKESKSGVSSGLEIKAEDLSGVKHPLEFLVSSYSYDDAGKELYSKDVHPVKVIKKGMPAVTTPVNPDRKQEEKAADSDLIPPLVLGCIFAVFIIVLIISLYCFCRRRKQRRYKASKNELKMQYSVEQAIDAQSDVTDDAHLLSPKFDNIDSPRRFHFRNCPALSLGKYNSQKMSNGVTKDDVYVLLEPNEDEKHMCTCHRKYMTLNSRDPKPKREKKKGLYKSTSSPSVLLSSDIDGLSIDPSELLDEEDYDISDVDKDQVVELNSTNQRFASLNRKGFKDSYDQFCTVDDSRRRLSSIEKTEVDKNMEVSQKLKELHDASSENSATESDRVVTPRDQQKEVITTEKAFDSNKSSGFGDGSHSNSDNESEKMDKATLLRPNGFGYAGYISDSGRRDPGYASDISTRSSPLDYMHRNKYNPPSQRHNMSFTNGNRSHPPSSIHSEEDGTPNYNYSRPIAPPSYNQAIVDIERLSEKNDITDSEEMFGNLLEMERQMGVNLEDSIDSDLNIKTLLPPPPRPYSNPRLQIGTEAGYMSDAQYSDREKTARCKQLLSEFKSTRGADSSCSKYSDLLDEELPINPPTLRSRSVMDDVLEEPREAGLRRSNSVGNSSVYKEWLV